MDELLLADSPIVVSAPTGSGKTVLFELAIIRLLEKCQKEDKSLLINKKILYLAPVKALCTERFNDWEYKFQKLGLKAIEVTGDSDEGNLLAIQHFNLVLTTPEKWDSLTRKWRDHTTLVEVINLILIDEVHLLNEEKRGSTLEAVISRMKTIQESSMPNDNQIRFIAVSATIPNIEDVAAWLGKKTEPAKHFKFGEEMRPVHLNKIVKTYPFKGAASHFKFDLNLSYKLKQIILDYAEGKPALIFCSTRKAVLQTSTTLLQNITFHFTPVQKMTLEEAREGLVDPKLKETVRYGVGFHHAGLSASDRNNIEELFKSGFLPILVSTSTLAMGVNLPAHLVVIKSTAQYVNGSWEEYSEGQMLQMMGRAGRPQFDSSATAVILTRDSLKEKYEKLLTGTDIVESSLHKNLAEHLNSEIVLGTITDIAVAVHWLRSTFFYVRAPKNPRYYGIPEGLTSGELESRLQAMCMRELNGLEKYELIKKTDFAYNVEPTENGKLMARLYIAFETMKLFMKVKGSETLPQMLNLICQCHEFSDIQLRVNERAALNLLNKSKTHETICFPLEGRIKNREMKVNCLIQAALGCLQIQDGSLIQESSKIMRISERLCKALSMYLWQRNWYEGLASALILSKSIMQRMWENSCYVTRQLPGIGPALGSLLAGAGKNTFKSIIESNPRDLERIINKHPPMGNSLQEAARSMPQYSLDLNYQEISRRLYICLKLVNYDKVIDLTHTFSLLISGCNNELLRKEKLRDGTLIERKGEINFTVNIPPDMNIEAVIVHVISSRLVGVDVKKVLAIFSKYQFFTDEDGPSINVFSSDEESMESSEKSYDEKVTCAVQQKKIVKKLPQKRESTAKLTNEKGKSNTKSKYQTNLNQYIFKSKRSQLKHIENEKSSSDNEVSSTQDYVSKCNPPSTSACLEKNMDIENKSSCLTSDSNNFKIEKRMKIDMEYKWYIEKNILTIAENEQKQIVTNVPPKIFNNTSSRKSNTNIIPCRKPLNVENTKTVGSKESEQHCSGFQNHQVLPFENKAKHSNSQNINRYHENDPNFCNISASNSKAVGSSKQYTRINREPLRLSPIQFLKTSETVIQNPHASNVVERIFYPLFIPTDNVSNKEDDTIKDKKTGKGRDSIPVIKEIEANKANDAVSTQKPSTPVRRKLSPRKSYELKTDSPAYSAECQVDSDSQNEFGKDLPGKSSLDQTTDSCPELNYDSTCSPDEYDLSEVDQVWPYEENNQTEEQINEHCKKLKQEVEEMSYCELDDLFLDSPKKNEKERDTTIVGKSFTNENKLIDPKVTRDKTSMQITHEPLLERKRDFDENDHYFSSTFDIRDFTKKQLVFGESIADKVDLHSVEEEVESYEEYSDGDSNSDDKTLRSDYGDPFAPVHDSATLQSFVEESKKKNIQKRNPSLLIVQTNAKSLPFNESHECNGENTTKQTIVFSEKEHSNYNFESSKQNYKNTFIPIVSPYFDEDSQPTTLFMKKTDFNCPSVKDFFPIQKKSVYEQHCTQYIYNENDNLKEERTITQQSYPQHYHNKKQSVNNHAIDFNNPTEEIEQYKKNMFQNSMFSQRKSSKKRKLDNTCSEREAHFGRLSNLLCNKRSLYTFQPASNLVSPSAIAFRASPEQISYRIRDNTNTNQENTCQLGPANSKYKPNPYNIDSASWRSPDLNLDPRVEQIISSEMESTSGLHHIYEQKYNALIESEPEVEYEAVVEPIANPRRKRLQTEVFTPSPLNEPDILNKDGGMEEQLKEENSPNYNMARSPLLHGSPSGSSSQEILSSPLSGEYIKRVLAQKHTSEVAYKNKTQPIFKYE